MLVFVGIGLGFVLVFGEWNWYCGLVCCVVCVLGVCCFVVVVVVVLVVVLFVFFVEFRLGIVG